MNFAFEYNYDEALRRQKRSQKEVDELRELAKEHPIVPRSLTNKQILMFLDSCGTPEEGAKVMKIYYEMRASSPEHFSNRDPDRPEIQQCLQTQYYVHLPNLPNGDHLLYHFPSSRKASDYHMQNGFKTFYMSIDSYLQKSGPRDGLVFLFDLKNTSIWHLMRSDISSLRKFFAYLQEGFPAKLRAIHILNTVHWVEKILMLIRPLIKGDILKVTHWHQPNMDYEKFYDEHIPKSCLPSDLGGDLKSVADLHENQCKELQSLKGFFAAEEKQANLMLDELEDFETKEE